MKLNKGYQNKYNGSHTCNFKFSSRYLEKVKVILVILLFNPIISKILFQHVINVKISNDKFYIHFLY